MILAIDDEQFQKVQKVHQYQSRNGFEATNIL